MDGLHEGEQVDMDRAKGVLHCHRQDISVIDGRNVYAAAAHQTGAEGQALRGIVVSADSEHRQIPAVETPSSQAGEEVVKELDRLRDGDGLVIDVPGN